MGLSVVKSICDRLEANISFESSLDKGSVFKVDLPVKPCRHPSRLKKFLNVLVVDDVELNTEIICNFLRSDGHEAMSSNDPVRAMGLAKQYEFDAILVDIHMPVINGEQFFVRLREQGVNSPIIGISAGLTDQLVGNLNEQGMTLLMDKPFSVEVFYSLLNREVSKTCTSPLSNLVDLNMLSELKCKMTEDDLASLFARFCAQCNEYSADLESAIMSRDAALTESLSHRIAGLVAAFGLSGVSSSAKLIHAAASVDLVDWVKVDEIREALNVQLEQGLDELCRVIVVTSAEGILN
jgi:CheY-like chemotaxis protein